MKGSVRKRGNTWSYRVDFGKSADGKRNQIEKGGYKITQEIIANNIDLIEKMKNG